VKLQQTSWSVFPDAFLLPFFFVTDAHRSFSGTSILIQQTYRSGAPVHAHAVGMSLQEPAMNCHESLHAGFPQMLLPSRENA